MRTLILTAAIATAARVSWGSVMAGPVVNPANGHSYYFLSPNTWTASESEAISLGGHLATINDDAEHAFLLSRFGSFGNVQRLLWIGLNDSAVEGQFVWVSGEPSTYTNWAPGEPNNVNGNEDFVAMYYPNHSTNGRWNDWNDRTSDPIGLPFHGVVEVVPEPLGASLSLSLSGLLLRRRQ